MFTLSEPTRVLDLGDDVRLDGAELQSVVTFLRDAMEHSRRVTWTCASAVSAEIAALLEHLPPPISGGGSHADRWREVHSFGLLFERRGGSFRTFRERRSAFDPALFTMQDPQLVRCLDQLATPTDHQCPTCAPLEDEGLVLRRRGSFLLLPFRLRYPPTPFLAI